MKFSLPDYHRLLPIKRIAPSRFFSAEQCMLREIWRSNRSPTLLPIHPAARLGSVAHRVLDRACKGNLHVEDVEMVWNDELTRIEAHMVEENEQHLLPLRKSASGYEVKKRQTVVEAQRAITESSVTNKLDFMESLGVQSEVWLESGDGLLGGYIDRIESNKYGVEITDYKTGLITDPQSNDVKKEYQIQLLLYAGLYFEKTGEWPSRLTLRNLAGTSREVSFEEEESLGLMNKARVKIEETNELILAGATPEHFANPNPTTCTYCGYRPCCTKYWKIRTQSPEWPNDVTGKIADVRTLGNDTLFVTLWTGQLTFSIRGLSSERFAFLKKKVPAAVICDLCPDIKPMTYRQTPLSAGFAVDQWLTP